MLVCVVVPIYKDYINLTLEEKTSLIQCLKVLNRYDICFIGPFKLDFAPYLTLASDFCNSCFVRTFKPIFFKNIAGYNKLLLSRAFYRSFIDFKYILIYQLDAYVFRDELTYWCKTGFDYIGAPWIDSDNVPEVGVGNGGLSLRNVSKSLNLFNNLRILEVLEFYNKYNLIQTLIRLPLILFDIYHARKEVSAFELSYIHNEDFFWGVAAPKRVKAFTSNSKVLDVFASFLFKDKFKVPSVEQALKFSFETNPRLLYERNNCQLPFGCHAWEKYDPYFWQKFICVPNV